jgi:hypothetical protein
VANNSERLLENPRHSDFTVKCGDKVYRVHKVMLSLHSTYFEGLFNQNEFEVLGSVILCASVLIGRIRRIEITRLSSKTIHAPSIQ